MAPRPWIRLPRQWPAHVKSGILHAISLASVVLSFARSRATGRRWLQAELEQANTEIALLREELYIGMHAGNGMNGRDRLNLRSTAVRHQLGSDHV